MIYLFDRAKKLQKIIPRKHLTDAKQTVVRNGLYQLSVTAPLFYETSKGTKYNHQKSIEKAWFAGHFDTDNRFQLYKIHTRNITADKSGEFILFDGVHIFFDEAKAMGNIHDRRFRDSEAKPAADAAFNLIGWTVTDYDVTDRHDINFYRASVTDAWNDLISTFNVEFDYELQFDGRKIISKNIIMKNKLGRWTGQRHAYGTNLLSLTQEQREGDIYTAAVGRGRGEEVGDGFGPRLEFGDIAWSKDGVEKPVGQNYIEIPSATQMYGYLEDGVIKPRIASEVVFEDVEDKLLLADSTYQWLLENCIPKATWKTEVSRFGHLNLGDGVGILYKDADIIKRARVEKIEHNLLDPKLSKLTLGDYHYFNQDKRQQRIDSTINRIRREANSRITQMKIEYTAWFDAQTLAIKNAHEQAVIDAHAEIQAAEERMEALITTTRNDWTDTFEAEVADIYRKAEEDYSRIEAEITGVIDSTRNDMEANFSSMVNDTRTYAEQQAQEKATAVRTDLETVTSGHQIMLEDLETNVMNIDDFIGPRDRSLQSILDEQRLTLEEKIEIYNRAYPNLLVGTSLGDISGFMPYLDSEIELREDESLSYIRTYPIRDGANGYEFPGFVYLEQGKTYTIGIDFRSEGVRDLDYIYFFGRYNNVQLSPISQTRGLIADGTWHRYYFTFDWINTSREAKLMIATNFNQGDTTRGWFDTRQTHLYEGDAHDIPWSPSASDNNQVVNQLLYEVRNLEDGMSTLATKTEVDLLTGNVTQLSNEYLSTSEQVSSKLQNFDDVLGVNGSHFTQIAEQVQSKVWLNDFTDINPNLIPFADVTKITEYWNRFGGNPSGEHATAIDSDGFYAFRDTVAENHLALESSTFEEIKEGRQYTLSFLAKTHSNINDNYNYTYIINPSGSSHFLGMWTNRKHIKDNIYLYEWTFEARWTGEARVLIGSTTTVGTDARIRFKEPKLERGNVRTPFLNAFSNIEQMANRIALQVQDMDGTYLRQSEIDIRPEYVQLGSQRFDGDTVGSLLRVSPSGIDAVAEAMRLSGDLFVKGDVQAYAMEAIEGEFTRLWADEFSAITIDVDDIEGFTARFEYLYTLNANIEKLVSQQVFANGVNALVGNFVDVNAGNIVTSGLSANVINSSHLDVDTTMVRKLFATSARIDQLITRNHYVDNVKALSLDVVYANISDLRTELLTANVINASHVNFTNALIQNIYQHTAFIENATIKAANIRDLNAIEISGNQLNLTTLTNRINQIEGGLRITRTDGVDWVRNGQARGHVPVQIFDSYSSDEVGFTGLNFYTGTSHWQTFKYFYTPHEGTRLRVTWAVGLHEGPSTIEYMEVRVRNFSSYSPINSGVGTSSRRVTIRQGETTYVTQDVSMPPPNYNEMAAYLEFRRAPDGQSINNVVRARILHIGQYE